MTAKTAAFIIGVIFIAVGLLGFIDNPIVGDSDKAIFHADKMHNFVHIGSGVLFVLIALAASAAVNGFMLFFGMVYLLIGILGFISFGTQGMGKVLGVLHVNGADNFLHAGLGLLIIIAGMATRKSVAAR